MPTLHGPIFVASDEHCIRWHYAEAHAAEEAANSKCPRELRKRSPMYWELSTRRQDEIRARVELVLAGEVRVSEMGPGDRAVYYDRTRLTAADDERIVHRFNGYRYEEHGIQSDGFERKTWYDFLGVDYHRNWQIQATNRIFGNAHVGNLAMSNLQVGGRLEYGPAILAHWYVTVQGDNSNAWLDILKQTRITLIVGEHPAAIEHGGDLWLGARSLGEYQVPCRQSAMVSVDFFGTALALLERMRRQPHDPERPTRGLFVHLDGYRARLVQ